MNRYEYQAKRSLKPALCCFSGEDGGKSFVRFRSFITNLHENVHKGDKSSIAILDIVKKYNILIELLNQDIKQGE